MLNNNDNKKGFGIVEIIVTIAVFTLSSIGIGLLVIDLLNTAERNQNLNQAIFIAFEGIEATKSIRNREDEGIFHFDGTRGLSIDSGQWEFLDTPDATMIGNLEYTREIIIQEIAIPNEEETITRDNSIKFVQSRVTWPRRFGGSAETVLHTYITNWNKEMPEPEDDEENGDDEDEGGGDEGGDDNED